MKKRRHGGRGRGCDEDKGGANTIAFAAAILNLEVVVREEAEPLRDPTAWVLVLEVCWRALLVGEECKLVWEEERAEFPEGENECECLAFERAVVPARAV